MTVPNTENLSIGREKQTNSDVELIAKLYVKAVVLPLPE